MSKKSERETKEYLEATSLAKQPVVKERKLDLVIDRNGFPALRKKDSTSLIYYIEREYQVGNVIHRLVIDCPLAPSDDGEADGSEQLLLPICVVNRVG